MRRRASPPCRRARSYARLARRRFEASLHVRSFFVSCVDEQHQKKKKKKKKTTRSTVRSASSNCATSRQAQSELPIVALFGDGSGGAGGLLAADGNTVQSDVRARLIVARRNRTSQHARESVCVCLFDDDCLFAVRLSCDRHRFTRRDVLRRRPAALRQQ
jgi:hypothetical protein